MDFTSLGACIWQTVGWRECQAKNPLLFVRNLTQPVLTLCLFKRQLVGLANFKAKSHRRYVGHTVQSNETMSKLLGLISAGSVGHDIRKAVSTLITIIIGMYMEIA